MVLRGGVSKTASGSASKRNARGQRNRSYEHIMKTLLLQNQQIIIQQQNMMFMVMKQLNSGTPAAMASTAAAGTMMLQQQQQLHLLEESLGNQPSTRTTTNTTHNHNDDHHHHHHQPQQHPQHHLPQSQQQQQQHPQTPQQQQQQQHQQQQHLNNMTNNNSSHHHNGRIHSSSNQLNMNTLQEDLEAYLTPASSEQEPLNDTMVPMPVGGPDSCALSSLLGHDGLMTNNLLYNPSTDFGSITPYKNQNSNHGSCSQPTPQHHHQQQPIGDQGNSSSQGSNNNNNNNNNHHQPQQHETPSYYSSGCESLATPRIEQQQRQPTSSNISQNVVKNLNDSFKSPSKPKISVQILSGSATRDMKNNKAKIIQSMNISEFLRQVHTDDSH